MATPKRGANGRFAPSKTDDLDRNALVGDPFKGNKDIIDDEGKSVIHKARLEMAVQDVLGDVRTPVLTRNPEDIGIEAYQSKADTKPLKCYHLYHIIDDDQIGKENEGRVERKYIGTFYASDLETAALKCCHIDNDYQTFGEIRDTMVGDVLCDNEGFYMICQTGFKLIAVLDDTE